MSVDIDEFLRWLAVRGVDEERLALYRECAPWIVREAGDAAVEPRHVEAARTALERARVRPQVLAQVRNTGDALRRFQRGTAAPPQPPAASVSTERLSPQLAWAGIAAFALAIGAAFGGGYLWWSGREADAAVAHARSDSATPSAVDLAEEQAVRRAYADFHAAMLAGDLPALRGLIAEGKLSELMAEDAAQKLELAKAMYPSDAKIMSVKITGASALITARAPMMGQTAKGRIDLVNQDGRWKVRNADWKVSFGDTDPEEEDEGGLAKTGRQIVRPADFPQLIGTWTGKETEGGAEWTFAFSSGHRLSAKSSRGEFYAGEVVIRWDLGIEDGVIHVPPGWAPLDVVIREAAWQQAVGKVALGAFSLSLGELKICGGQPGLRKRVRSFEAKGAEFRCMVLSKTAGVPETARAAAEAETAAQPSAESAPGYATLVFDGAADRYELRTRFGSDTELDRPEQATLDFAQPAPGRLNARRLVLTLDATRTGRHYADGQAIHDMMFNDRNVAIGEPSEGGAMAVLKWIADGGQVYPPKPGTGCEITVSSPYTGRPGTAFVAEISRCAVHSAGIDHTLSNVKLRIDGPIER